MNTNRIKCPTCGKENMDTVHNCVYCNSPIQGTVRTEHVVTTQLTSKRLKLFLMISIFMAIGGIIGVFAISDETMRTISFMSMLIGSFGFFITKFYIWWHHK